LRNLIDEISVSGVEISPAPFKEIEDAGDGEDIELSPWGGCLPLGTQSAEGPLQARFQIDSTLRMIVRKI
jgi:hypothetical protein